MVKFEIIGRIIGFAESVRNFKAGPTRTGKGYKNIILQIEYEDNNFKRTKKKGWLRAWNDDAEMLRQNGFEGAWIFAELNLERNKDRNGNWHDDWIIQNFHLFRELIISNNQLETSKATTSTSTVKNTHTDDDFLYF